MHAHALSGPFALLAATGGVEAMAQFLAFPPVSALLVAAGFLGLLLEFKTAGWGVGGTLGVVAFGLFFWSHMTLGYAGWEAVLMVAVGLTLLALEVFVIPGFGIAGTLGLVATFGGIFLALVGDLHGVTEARLVTAAGTLGGAVLLVGGGAVALVKWLPTSRHMDRMVLKDTVERLTPPHEDPYRAWEKDLPSEGDSLAGHRGVAVTDLRPVGTAEIDGTELHVVTRGSYVEKGTAIEVVEDLGNRKVVRPIHETD